MHLGLDTFTDQVAQELVATLCEKHVQVEYHPTPLKAGGDINAIHFSQAAVQVPRVLDSLVRYIDSARDQPVADHCLERVQAGVTAGISPRLG